MTLKASVNYHVQSHEAQAFQFDVDGISGNLVAPELVPTQVNVKDNRDHGSDINFANDGITFVTQPSVVTEFDEDRAWQPAYDQEIQALLAREINALEVIVFDHTIRIDDQGSARQPARNVHNDYSPDGANQRLVNLVGEVRAKTFQEGAFALVNVWRPISPVITTSPLGFIHPTSMDNEDWMTIDMVYPDRKGEILGVAANPKHEWFYQSNMRSDDVVIFNVYDNQGRPYLAHSALDIVGQSAVSAPRISIETRTLVRYA
ncbi:hypothetical protein A1OW_09085 [Enterovibrio norvegicus]|uniref:Methyltransferase n=1 Tax=Enterovibrio norvegicus DSM 15893 TaxID=1121869 RepID=A0A1I5MDD3_9GAMM|nr:CmcJ/NvfI family oxidoreductase [Enterovibrio norvegicus]OEF52425.1 hypothetical protein A1OW_09085 [Enterovibrio norvegicus]SFP07628.1 hypothetical protein SAMN03084138_01280 [Enterovibrio norvegicus DSM 15893]